MSKIIGGIFAAVLAFGLVSVAGADAGHTQSFSIICNNGERATIQSDPNSREHRFDGHQSAREAACQAIGSDYTDADNDGYADQDSRRSSGVVVVDTTPATAQGDLPTCDGPRDVITYWLYDTQPGADGFDAGSGVFGTPEAYDYAVCGADLR